MAKLLKLRRGTTSQHSSFTGAEGELTVDTTKDTAVVHDGTTQGGRPLLREDLDNMPASGVSAGTYGSSTALPVITVNAEGLVTSATTSAIDSTAITNGSAGIAVVNNGPINATGNLNVSAGLDVTGNISVTGTVDGRDVAADGTKLDGIESGATADQTATEILNAIKTVDGSGSGLDADLLDGESANFYRNASNLNAGTISSSLLPVINSVPSGAILLWSGASNALPSGYVLCDGNNSTPDLRDRFVVGAGSTYAVNSTGGANNVTLATANLPSHTHGTGNHSHGVNSHTHSTPNHSHGVNSHTHSTPSHNHNMNSHTHNGSTSGAGGHAHNISVGVPNNNRVNTPYILQGWGRYDHIQNYNTGNVGDHTHNFSTSNAASNTNSSGGGTTGSAGANTTTSGGGTSGSAGANTTAVSAGTTGATGSGSSFDKRPPFFALCYIMKS